jgi:hypothetical protein
LYKNKNFFDIFKKNGKLLERKYITLDIDEKIELVNIKYVLLPRLDWSDRYVDIM